MWPQKINKIILGKFGKSLGNVWKFKINNYLCVIIIKPQLTMDTIRIVEYNKKTREVTFRRTDVNGADIDHDITLIVFSKKQYLDYTKPASVKNKIGGALNDTYLIENWASDTMRRKHGKGKVTTQAAVTNGINNYYRELKQYDTDRNITDNIDNLMFDCSFMELWDIVREKLGLSETEAYYFSWFAG
jgi:hypothetical protein